MVKNLKKNLFFESFLGNIDKKIQKRKGDVYENVFADKYSI